MMEAEEETRSSRKRARVVSWKSKKSRRIVFKSCHKLRSPVFLNDCVNISSILFTNPNDFLITNDGRKVRESELSGKTILLYMEPLTGFDFLETETFHLIETYHELWPKGGFEVVFAPVKRGDDHDDSEKRFNDLFSQMPWPAVPFSNKLACDRVEHLSNRLARESTYYPYYPCPLPCPWVILSPRGKVLLKHERDSLYRRFFNYLGGADCPLSKQELLRLEDEDEATLEAGSVINLHQLLATPSRDFVLTKDGKKVPISSLEDKVVGLYLRDDPTPCQMEEIKKVYQEALDLGYNFEIVQINFHFRNKCKQRKIGTEDIRTEPCRENIPWLTLPFKDTCCRRVRRIFKVYKGYWEGERLIIINPHEPNISGIFFDIRGTHIIREFGIEAYPFMKRRVVELEFERRRQGLRLQQNLGPLLLRGRAGEGCGFDRIPVSRLWGKSVLVVFASHSRYKSSKHLRVLKAKYLEQDLDNLKFEVVYVSIDRNASSFGKCTKGMPWLVHPYSLDFAELCFSKLFVESSLSWNLSIAAAAFHVDGELLAKTKYYRCDVEEYPFMCKRSMDWEILCDVTKMYRLEETFFNELII